MHNSNANWDKWAIKWKQTPWSTPCIIRDTSFREHCIYNSYNQPQLCNTGMGRGEAICVTRRSDCFWKHARWSALLFKQLICTDPEDMHVSVCLKKVQGTCVSIVSIDITQTRLHNCQQHPSCLYSCDILLLDGEIKL